MRLYRSVANADAVTVEDIHGSDNAITTRSPSSSRHAHGLHRQMPVEWTLDAGDKGQIADPRRDIEVGSPYGKQATTIIKHRDNEEAFFKIRQSMTM